MKLAILFLSLFAPGVKESAFGTYTITGTKPDPTLGRNEAFVELTIKCPEGSCTGKKIAFKLNDKKEYFVKLNAKGKSVHKIPAGEHDIDFMATDCQTIKAQKIKIEEKTRVFITVEFVANNVNADKPVIYLYPEKTTDVSVNLNVNGELNFSYPLYNNGWKVKAHADGTLEANGREYNYLFWEGKTPAAQFSNDFNSGFIVSTDTLVSFLETSLAKAGLNYKEATDFITYWVPRMQNNPVNFVHFTFTAGYDRIAQMNVNPQPNNQIRLYMTWCAVPEGNNFTTLPQEFPTFSRSGFTLVEWGGSEISFKEEN